MNKITTTFVLIFIILISGCTGQGLKFTTPDGGKLKVSDVDLPLDMQEVCKIMEEYQNQELNCLKIQQIPNTVFYSYELSGGCNEESIFHDCSYTYINLDAEKMTIGIAMMQTA